MSRLVIVAPNWLGDAVMALPAIADLRRGLPDATIAVAAKPAVASLFTMVRDVDDVIEKNATRLVADVALLLPNSFRSALDVVRAGVRERWGYRTDCRGPLLTRGIDRPSTGLHQVEYYQHLVQALGFQNGSAQPRLDVSPTLRTAGGNLLAAEGWNGAALVALAPGGAFGRAKRWPPAYFAELARAFTSDDVGIAIVGTAADDATRREINAALGRNRGALIDLVGRTDVPMLAGVLSHARALVANDSGVMHLGAALGLPTAALFGPTDERLTAPRSTSAHAVLTHPVWCRPCMLRDCPLDHRCMRGISVADVADAARRMM